MDRLKWYTDDERRAILKRCIDFCNRINSLIARGHTVMMEDDDLNWREIAKLDPKYLENDLDAFYIRWFKDDQYPTYINPVVPVHYTIDYNPEPPKYPD